jgi:hypothetical protein
MIGYMASFEDVRFITASDAIEIYRPTEISYDAETIGSILDALGDTVKHLELKGGSASASELFYLVTRYLAEYSKDGMRPSGVQTREPLGPVSMADFAAPSEISTTKILDASIKILEQIDETGRLPSSVRLADGIELSTADFMVLEGKVLRLILSGAPIPSEVRSVKARFLESSYIDPEAFQEACRWVVLPRGFKAPKLLEQIILQTWTLKPAVAAAMATTKS